MHRAQPLFVQPPENDGAARLGFVLNRLGRYHVCLTCAAVGYRNPGKVRVRWHIIGAESRKAQAAEWNARYSENAISAVYPENKIEAD